MQYKYKQKLKCEQKTALKCAERVHTYIVTVYTSAYRQPFEVKVVRAFAANKLQNAYGLHWNFEYVLVFFCMCQCMHVHMYVCVWPFVGNQISSSASPSDLRMYLFVCNMERTVAHTPIPVHIHALKLSHAHTLILKPRSIGREFNRKLLPGPICLFICSFVSLFLFCNTGGDLWLWGSTSQFSTLCTFPSLPLGT